MKRTDLMGCASATIILLIVSDWIPVFGLFFNLLAPLPFLYYLSKLGRHEGLMTVGATLLIVGVLSFLAGYPEKLIFCVEFGFLGFILSESYRRHLTFGRTIFWGTAAMVLVGTLFLFFIGLSQDMGPKDMAMSYLQGNLQESVKAYESMGLEQEKILQLQEYGRLLNDIVSKIYLSLVIIGTGFVVWLNVVMSRPIFRAGGLSYPAFGPMDRWRAPEHMVWGFIAAGFALFFSLSAIKSLAINAFIVMSVVYIFHGLSIVLFFLNKYRIPRLLRVGVYILIVFQQILLIGLAAAGLFDQWIDFRKISKPNTI